MAGDDANPAVPGTTRTSPRSCTPPTARRPSTPRPRYGTLASRPEMSTCETASEADPDDEWDPADCESGFNFPDDEALVQAEFEKNVPFAIATAQSAADPDDPVSVVGRDTPTSCSTRSPCPTATPSPWRSSPSATSCDGGCTTGSTAGRPDLRVAEWAGGERYGDPGTILRRVPRHGAGRRAGDSSRSGSAAIRRANGPVESDHFTYTVASDSGADVLDHRQRGLHRREPDLPGRHQRAQVRRRLRGRARRQRHLARHVGRRCPGRAPPPRRAQPLRRGRLGTG